MNLASLSVSEYGYWKMRPESLMAALAPMVPKVMIWATCSCPPYLSVTYFITSERPETEKSMSTSGMLIRSGFRNRSKSSE
jgi:hypothetical protein